MPSSSPEPEVSFVIPARNERELLPGALASIAAQTRASIEAVVVDNASTDGTAAEARLWAERHPNVPVRILHEPAVGRAQAKNAGARAARGELLIFLDADSRAEPGLADAVVARDGAGWPAGAIRVTADSSDPLDRFFFSLLSLGPRLFGIRAQLFYCRRELFVEAGGFDERLRLAEDQDFLDRLRGRRVGVAYISDQSIATSPRRLRSRPLRIGTLLLFCRWFLANFGVGRRWRY